MGESTPGMKKLFQSMLLLFARADDSEPARQVQFLKTENEREKGREGKRGGKKVEGIKWREPFPGVSRKYSSH